MKSENEMLMNMISNIDKSLIIAPSKVHKQDTKRDTSKKKCKTSKSSNNQTIKQPASKATLDIVSKSNVTSNENISIKNQDDKASKVIKKVEQISKKIAETNNNDDIKLEVRSKVDGPSSSTTPTTNTNKQQPKNHLERENILSFGPIKNK